MQSAIDMWYTHCIATVDAMSSNILKCLRLDPELFASFSRRVILHQHILLLGRVNPEFYLSFQQVVKGFEQQSRTKYGPLCAHIHHDTKHIDKDTNFLEVQQANL